MQTEYAEEIKESTRVGADAQTQAKRLRRAERALAAGDAKAALAAAEAVVAEDPKHLPALEALAKALWQLGDLPRLCSVLEGMIRLNPYEPGYFSLLGAAQQSLGQIGRAIGSLGRSVALGGDGATGAANMLEELRGFQAVLIEDVRAVDARFRAEFAADPAEACRRRGFEIEVPESASPRAEPRAFAFLSARPS